MFAELTKEGVMVVQTCFVGSKEISISNGSIYFLSCPMSSPTSQKTCA